MVHPEIKDMHLPPFGAFHNLVIVSLKKEFPGHPQKVMNAIWGTGQLMFSKCVVVVDDDINVSDLGEVLFRVTSNVDPKRDFLFSEVPSMLLIIHRIGLLSEVKLELMPHERIPSTTNLKESGLRTYFSGGD